MNHKKAWRKDMEIDKDLDLKKMAPAHCTEMVLISSVLLALFLLFREHI